METETIRAAIAGDRAALETFAAHALKYAIGVAVREGAAPWDADDIGQDVAAEACAKLSALREPAAWTGWIGTAARRAVIRTAEERRRGAVSGDALTDTDRPVETDPEGIPDAEPGPAVLELPETMRRAVLLHYFDGLSVRETARALGLTLNGAKCALQRGRRRMSASVARGLRLSAVEA